MVLAFAGWSWNSHLPATIIARWGSTINKPLLIVPPGRKKAQDPQKSFRYDRPFQSRISLLTHLNLDGAFTIVPTFPLG